MVGLLPAALIVLYACDSGSVKLGGDTAAAGGDTASSDSAETGADSGTDSGADSGTDSGTDSGSSAPEPDYSVWAGTRTFSYAASWGDCTESVDESGVELTSGSAYDALKGACTTCDRVYQIDLSSDTVCTWLALANPTWRGLRFLDGTAEVYGFHQNSDGSVGEDVLDDAAPFDGWTLRYAYAVDYGYTIDITSTIAFPELSP